MLRRSVGAAALAACLLLSGCSGNPGPAGIKQAIRNDGQMMAAIDALASFQAELDGQSPRNASDIVEAGTIEVGECVSASGASGVVCDFRMVLDGQSGKWTKARFFQAGGQWQMEQVK